MRREAERKRGEEEDVRLAQVRELDESNGLPFRKSRPQSPLQSVSEEKRRVKRYDKAAMTR